MRDTRSVGKESIIQKLENVERELKGHMTKKNTKDQHLEREMLRERNSGSDVEGAEGEGGKAFISDSNRADRQHPGGQQAQSREQPRQTKGLFKLGELP